MVQYTCYAFLFCKGRDGNLSCSNNIRIKILNCTRRCFLLPIILNTI